MNTRALMELVVINIGYDLGVLPKSVFTMLVIMAILSTFVATPFIKMFLGKKPVTVVNFSAPGQDVLLPKGLPQ